MPSAAAAALNTRLPLPYPSTTPAEQLHARTLQTAFPAQHHYKQRFRPSIVTRGRRAWAPRVAPRHRSTRPRSPTPPAPVDTRKGRPLRRGWQTREWREPAGLTQLSKHMQVAAQIDLQRERGHGDGQPRGRSHATRRQRGNKPLLHNHQRRLQMEMGMGMGSRDGWKVAQWPSGFDRAAGAACPWTPAARRLLCIAGPELRLLHATHSQHITCSAKKATCLPRCAALPVQPHSCGRGRQGPALLSTGRLLAPRKWAHRLPRRGCTSLCRRAQSRSALRIGRVSPLLTSSSCMAPLTANVAASAASLDPPAARRARPP
jgi:hypothetical protein